MYDRGHRIRSGFTLVELLVVIAIIAILVGLALPAINLVRRKAYIARIGFEIKQLESAVEAYREKYGDYPPDFSNKLIVERHVRKIWPRIAQNEFDLFWRTVWVNPNDNSNHQTYVDPAEALVFWLGGFSDDARRPFFGKGGPFIFDSGNNRVYINEDRNKGFFEFEPGRLTMQMRTGGPGRISNDTDNDAFPVYYPAGKKAPYVYFDARAYSTRRFYTHSSFGTVSAYASDRVRSDPNNPSNRIPEWVNPTSFQIISAGLDDHFGTYRDVARQIKLFPSGRTYDAQGGTFTNNGYTLQDEDNISNFSDGREFKGLMP